MPAFETRWSLQRVLGLYRRRGGHALCRGDRRATRGACALPFWNLRRLKSFHHTFADCGVSCCRLCKASVRLRDCDCGGGRQGKSDYNYRELRHRFSLQSTICKKAIKSTWHAVNRDHDTASDLILSSMLQFHHILSRGRHFHVIWKAKVHAKRSFICSSSDRRCNMSRLPPNNIGCCRSNRPLLGHIPRPDNRRCHPDNRTSRQRNRSSSHFPPGSRCRRRSTGSRWERTARPNIIPIQMGNRRVSLRQGLCLAPPML
jgi:hypothetical protein